MGTDGEEKQNTRFVGEIALPGSTASFQGRMYLFDLPQHTINS